MKPAPPQLTGRFLAAVELASEVHGGQRRKGTRVPYLAHLLVVAGLVLEDGGDEAEAIAALLHDTVDDGGGAVTLERIADSFGPRVAEIVEACSEHAHGEPRGPWRERKERYLEHLPDVHDDGVLRVSLADKVHNGRSIVRVYREEGDALWARFATKTAHDVLWFYGTLAEFFAERRPGPLTEDLQSAIAELTELLGRDAATSPDARHEPGAAR